MKFEQSSTRTRQLPLRECGEGEAAVSTSAAPHFLPELPHLHREAKRLLREGKARLEANTHPDPYVCACCLP